MLRNMTSRLIQIDRGTGAVAVELAGDGPLVLCVPGIGDLRSSYRHLSPRLVAAGYRVAAMDLRGHGDSSAAFREYGDEAAAEDVLAVLDAFGGGPAAVIGNSMGAAAAVIAAAERPEAVDRLVLIGPFVRDGGSAFARLAFRAALLRPWGPAVWRRYYASLFPAGGPADQAENLDAVHRALRGPGRWRAFQRTAAGSHAAAETALPLVRADTLVLMGALDSDWPDPAAEADWVAAALSGQARMIPGTGHYPQAEKPDEVAAAVLPFLRKARVDG